MPNNSNPVLKFPEGFLWGTATAAYQVEGNNVNADWWEWEQKKFKNKESGIKNRGEKNNKQGLKSIHTARSDEKGLFVSGKGPDHYHRFEKDFDIAKGMHNNAHRLSIEWSRIEPHEGIFDQKEIEHYRRVLEALRERGMKAMVTLHHFTNPSWFARKGGWLKRRNVRYFLRYVDLVVNEYIDLVDFWVTINEPNVYVQMGYLGGWGVQHWPPEKKSIVNTIRVFLNMARAHRKAYRLIHATDSRQKKPMVGIAQSFASYATTRKHNLYDLFIVFLIDNIANHSFYYLTKHTHDFIGVNYYFRVRFFRKQWMLLPKIVNISEQGREQSDMDAEIYPHGIYSVLMDLRDYGLPIYITENGVAEHDDHVREKFLVLYIQEIYYAMKAGVPVKGHFFWSLLDNFEWDLGYTQKFGLVEWDPHTQERREKPSAHIYARICQANGIPHDLLAYSFK